MPTRCPPPARRSTARPTLLRLGRLGGGLAIVLLGSIRCQVALDPQPLQRFETCEALQVYLEDQIINPGVEQSFVTGGPVVGCSSSFNDALAPRAGEGEGEGERFFTTTNTQEVEVDEPDFVKNNGDVIFVLRRGAMIILSAWPADDMHVLSRTTIPGTPFQMLFDNENQRALVFSNFFTDQARVLVKLFDVANPAQPIELRTLLIDGTFVDARMVGTEVMFVSRSFLALDGVFLDRAPFTDDENRARLRAAGLGRLLPKVSDFIVGQDLAPRVDRAIACENTYAPSRSDGRSILLVHALDMARETLPLRSTGVVAGFSHVYGSTRSLYLASTEFSDGGYFTPGFATTRIHKLAAFEGAGAAEYQATAVVTGTIRDELSLDEDENGLLRMVITDSSQSQDFRQQATSLVVLERKEGSTALTEIARVDDIGRGENVESVRFIGDKAYIVTYPSGRFLFFNQSGFPITGVPFTDPLFVIDLADPRAPRLRGELEVDGYSAYIYPLGDDHLLTVGVNTDADTGALLSLSLILFDVSDPDRPSLLHRHDFGDSETGSEALVDRHAFTYFAREKALAIPVQKVSRNTGLESTGLAVFEVDVQSGFTELGIVEQRDLYVGLTDFQQGFPTSCAAVRRGVMISDPVDGAFVYAISTGGVTASAIAPGLPLVATVQLRAADEQVCSFGSPL
jgi:hypothetical protein